jgi:WD40 repeat protein
MMFSFAILLAASSVHAAPPPIVAVAVAPGGEQVVTSSQASVQFRSLPKLEVTATFPTELSQVHDLAFSPDGKTLALVGGSPAESGAVELREWPSGKLQGRITAGGDVAYRAAWNADGSRLAVACADRKVRLEVLASAVKPQVIECHSAAVLATAWLAGDDLILSAGVDQVIRVLAAADGRVTNSLDNHTAAVRDLAIRPGRHEGPTMVASCSADKTVRFWQPTIGRLVRFVRLPSPPTVIGWTPSGSHVLAACEDGKLRSVDPTTLAVIEFAQRLDGWAHALAVLPDGSAAILGGERGQLRLVPLDAIKP